MTSEDFRETDGAAREETEEQYEAYRDGLSELLTHRWGHPHVFSLSSVLDRVMDGEDIPEPWGALSTHVPDVHFWDPHGQPAWSPPVPRGGTASCRSNCWP
jgi:hypothetical protein